LVEIDFLEGFFDGLNAFGHLVAVGAFLRVLDDVSMLPLLAASRLLSLSMMAFSEAMKGVTSVW